MDRLAGQANVVAHGLRVERRRPSRRQLAAVGDRERHGRLAIALAARGAEIQEARAALEPGLGGNGRDQAVVDPHVARELSRVRDVVDRDRAAGETGARDPDEPVRRLGEDGEIGAAPRSEAQRGDDQQL
jgi:hypothetical protein